MRDFGITAFWAAVGAISISISVLIVFYIALQLQRMHEINGYTGSCIGITEQSGGQILQEWTVPGEVPSNFHLISKFGCKKNGRTD